MSDTRERATATGYWEGVEDHGCISAHVRLAGHTGWGQAFGTLLFDKQEQLDVWRQGVLDVFGVETVEEISGRECFVLRNWGFYDIEGIEVDGRRFTLESFRRKLWPGKDWSPLARRQQSMRDRIESNKRQNAELLRDIERVEREYVDWSLPPNSDGTKEGA